MMFLFKLAFWLGLVLVLLPTGSKQQTDTPQISAAQAATAATSAVSDISQFCTRQPGTCSVGSQVATILARRAQDGAVLIYQFITERREASPEKAKVVPVRHETTAKGRGDNADTTGSIAPAAPAMVPRPRPGRTQDTLTVTDRAPAWRKPELVQQANLAVPSN
jgi:hypothetical protein